jgi:Mn2+ and Fe2+ transporters of the NRAMP family
MGAAVKLLAGGPSLLYVAAFGLGTVLLEVFMRYSRYVSVLKWLSLSLLAYVATAFIVDLPWGQWRWAVFVPHLTWSRDYLVTIVAVLGTTISPYLFFWQAESEVEDTRRRRNPSR